MINKKMFFYAVAGLLCLFWPISTYSQINNQEIYNTAIEKYIEKVYKASNNDINIEVYYFLNITSLKDSIYKKKINYVRDREDLRKLLTAKNKSIPISTLSCIDIEEYGILSVSLLHFTVTRVNNNKNYKYNYARSGTTSVLFKYNCDKSIFEYYDFKHEDI
jgi:hypothetical protein